MYFVRPPVCYSRRTCKERERTESHSVWRDATHANCYRNDVLNGNWMENRHDVKIQSVARPLPSDYDHHYDSTYNVDYNKHRPKHCVHESLKNLKRHHPHSYESHQPEFDSDYMKALYNSWQTTSGAAYIDPRLQRDPSALSTFILSPTIKDPANPCYFEREGPWHRAPPPEDREICGKPSELKKHLEHLEDRTVWSTKFPWLFSSQHCYTALILTSRKLNEKRVI